MELSVHDLSKDYKNSTVVNNVNLTLTPGIWGLLGANGAGKTTLMRMMAGILTPTSGEITYMGNEIVSLDESYRKILGYLPQKFGYYPEFTVFDYLNYISSLKGIEKKEASAKINDLLEKLSLVDVKSKRVSKLSGGMERRVGIAQALLNEPDILILDEPTSGLDPGERIRLRNILSGFSQNKIVLISTHIVSDIEYVADNILVMKKGEIIEEGMVDELISLVNGKVWDCVIPATELKWYENKVFVVSVRSESRENISIRYVSDTAHIPNSSIAQPRLEGLYLWLFRDERMEEPQNVVAGT